MSISFDPDRVIPSLKYYSRDKVLLDVGCGRGDYTRLFSKLGFNVVGLDISISKKYVTSSMCFVMASAAHMPFRKQSIGGLFVNEVFEHVNNDCCFLEQLLFISSFRAILVLYAPNRFYPWETHFTFYGIPSFFVSYLPEFVRKLVFGLMRVPYVSIYDRKKLYNMLSDEFHIVKYQEIMPTANSIRNIRGRNLVKRFIGLLINPFTRMFGVSVFMVGVKKGKIART